MSNYQKGNILFAQQNLIEALTNALRGSQSGPTNRFRDLDWLSQSVEDFQQSLLYFERADFCLYNEKIQNVIDELKIIIEKAAKDSYYQENKVQKKVTTLIGTLFEIYQQIFAGNQILKSL